MPRAIQVGVPAGCLVLSALIVSPRRVPILSRMTSEPKASVLAEWAGLSELLSARCSRQRQHGPAEAWVVVRDHRDPRAPQYGEDHLDLLHRHLPRRLALPAHSD